MSCLRYLTVLYWPDGIYSHCTYARIHPPFIDGAPPGERPSNTSISSASARECARVGNIKPEDDSNAFSSSIHPHPAIHFEQRKWVEVRGAHTLQRDPHFLSRLDLQICGRKRIKVSRKQSYILAGRALLLNIQMMASWRGGDSDAT